MNKCFNKGDIFGNHTPKYLLIFSDWHLRQLFYTFIALIPRINFLYKISAKAEQNKNKIFADSFSIFWHPKLCFVSIFLIKLRQNHCTLPINIGHRKFNCYASYSVKEDRLYNWLDRLHCSVTLYSLVMENL